MGHLSSQLVGVLRKAWRRMVPGTLRHWLWAIGQKHPWPPVDRVRFGNLRRLTPIGRWFGFDRGLPIDRYYIEGFLAHQAADIGGHVLEVGDARYTRMFGGNRVTKSDVLYATVGEPGPEVTIIADLTDAEHVPADTFDCIILTQTLLFIYDVRAAVKTLYRILKPGGVVLVTVPGITQIDHGGMEIWGHYWGFTVQSAQRLFEEFFPTASITVESRGNVLAASAFLYGLATHELRQDELDYHDADYQVNITIRAMKPRATAQHCSQR